MKKNWIDLLEGRYKNLRTPDYSFVLDELEKKPYQKLIDDICKRFLVKEDTDENYDVSFGYLLSFAPAGDCLLRVSMVAPFAFFARINERGSTSKPIIRECTHDEADLAVIEIIESHGISLLDAKTLEALVPDAGKESKPLYQWMFVDEENPPWS
jgi:hypothetical protein